MHYLFNNRFISDYNNVDFFENKMSLHQSIHLDNINNNENMDKNYDILLYNSLISYDDSNFMICRFDDSNKPHQDFDHILRKIIINYNDDKTIPKGTEVTIIQDLFDNTGRYTSKEAIAGSVF